MSKELYKIGDLVYCTSVMSHSQQRGGFGIITNIINKDVKESYHEKEVITGCGDQNTRVNIEIELLTSEVRDLWDVSIPFKVLDKKIKVFKDPHDVIMTNKKRFDKDYKEKMENLQKMLEFRTKYYLTRDDKINIILD